MYYVVLLCLIGVCAALVKGQYDALRKMPTSKEFEGFQKRFLLVYLLAMSADWIQGPYLYKLYSFYGFSKKEIGFLFVCGFGSSAVFGTLIGGLADKMGRRRTCLIYCVIYAMSCMAMHSKSFEVLVAGRMLGGMSTSILFSVFEVWMLHEHKRAAFPDEWLVKTLSYMTFLSSMSAVLCAVLAAQVTEAAGYVAPFDAAIVFLSLSAACIFKLWGENFGDSTVAPGANFAVGWVVMASNPKIWLLGVIQSCFEGAMYVFVFSWTPILEGTAEDERMPHGAVFACFMVAIMIGTNLYQKALKTYSTEQILRMNALVASLCLGLPAVTKNHSLILFAFCSFEVCVGVYFPAIGFLRAKFIPEEVRATVVNFFRIPLNALVVMILLNIAHMSSEAVSLWSAFILVGAAAAQEMLTRIAGSSSENVRKVQQEEL